jgi:hypothetical protein
MHSSYIRGHIRDISGRVALYGAVIVCVVVGLFLLRLLSVALRKSPYPIELLVAAIGVACAVVGIAAAAIGFSLMRRSLIAHAAWRVQLRNPPSMQWPSQIDSDSTIELVEADVIDPAAGKGPHRSLPRGAQTLLVLSMRREAAKDVIESLGELYPLQTKYYGKMRASTLVWMNVAQIISFRPVTRLAALVAGIFASPRL